MSELTKRTVGGGVERKDHAEAGVGCKEKAKIRRLDRVESVMFSMKTLVALFVLLTFFVLFYFIYDKQNTFHYDQIDENRINRSVTTELFLAGHFKI